MLEIVKAYVSRTFDPDDVKPPSVFNWRNAPQQATGDDCWFLHPMPLCLRGMDLYTFSLSVDFLRKSVETLRMIPAANTPSQRVRRLALAKGLLRAKDLAQVQAPRSVLAQMVKKGALERVDYGVYRLREEAAASEYEDLEIVSVRAPQSVFCLLTALHFHDLTTQLPRQVWIAMPQGSHTPRMAWPPLKMVQTSGALHDAGVERVSSGGTELRVYCPARTVVDCFKHRSKVGLDVAIEALRDARQQRKVTPDELWHYAKLCKVTNVMIPYLLTVR